MIKSVVYLRGRREEGRLTHQAGDEEERGVRWSRNEWVSLCVGDSYVLADDQPLSIARCALDRCKAAGGMRSRK